MQSVLNTQGPEAEAIAELGWIMFGGATLICLGVAALLVVAMRGGSGWRGVVASERFVVVTGILLPIVVLTGLLVYGLMLTGGRLAVASRDALKIEVVGEQWWWRMRYLADTADAVETANELRLPVGRDVELRLVSRDVIHAFWVPSLAGKVDLIPGKANRLRLHAARAGVYRGQCAEYCGGPHAWMSFDVVALEGAAFDAWLARHRRPAAPPDSEAARAGQGVFFRAGCRGCHTVRGTDAAGTIGPDLTHVAGRLSLGAASMANDPHNLRRWLYDNQHIKPGNRMPTFGFLEARDLDVLAAYLASLK